MLATKPSKKHFANNTKKTLKKEGLRRFGPGSWGPLNEQKTTLSRQYKGRKHALAASAVADILLQKIDTSPNGL